MAIKFAPKSEPTPPAQKTSQPMEKPLEDAETPSAKKDAQPKARKPAKPVAKKDDELF